jgi:hypothetical protein
MMQRGEDFEGKEGGEREGRGDGARKRGLRGQGGEGEGARRRGSKNIRKYWY